MTDLAVYGRLDELQRRVAQLEAALAYLANATGVTFPSELMAESGVGDDPVALEVAELLRSGKRSKAVSVAAKKGKLGLAEATAYVGEIEARL
jgi:hypothetical protein